MRFIIIILVVLISQMPVSAQEPAQVKNSNEFIELDITPLTIFSFRPRYRIGIEYYNGNWSYAINGAYGSYGLNHYLFRLDRWGMEYKYYSIRPQLSYCFNSFNQFKQYIGIETFYITNSDRFTNDHFYYVEEPFDYYTYEQADYQRSLIGMHILYETKHQFDYVMGIEFYLGVGFGYRMNEYTNVEGLQITEHFINEAGVFFKDYRKDGSGWVASGTIGINISFFLWRK